MSKRANGEGSIFKLKNGRWRAELTLGFDPQTGKQLRRTKTAKTRGEAKSLLKQLQDYYGALPAGTGPQTLEAFTTDWLTTKSGSVRPRTLDSYQRTFSRHVYPTLGKTKLEDLKTYEIQRLLDSVAKTSGKRTANYVRTVFNIALNQAVKWQLMVRNPVYGTIRQAENPRPQTIWTPEEIRRFLSVAISHRLYALFYLALTTGLRRGELLGLTWADVKEDAITVVRSVSTHHGKVVEGPPKSASGRRVVAIDPATRYVLRQHEDRQRLELEQLGMAENEVPQRVFTHDLGGTIDGSNLTRIWHRLQEEAGVPRARLHDARHMHLSMLIGKGVDVRTVSDRAGHADTVLTLRQYAHALDAQRKRAAMSLDELIGD